ncbi:hypothetical protein [Cryobacterium sp. Y57]|uniref:hypothetical protein n=1 Tax=Cryobacterium sp. Y57 TaxID=2048287 RepID=UPI000CE2E42B|nr:hypothetical protein [Cryobacterium sp. Y57]
MPQLAWADLRAGTQDTRADADLGLRILPALPTLVHAVTIAAGSVLLIGILYRAAVASVICGRC